ncbi:MAG: type I 3-dehydroquinate dehydratase [Phycisphaerales bacterium]|nr:type I 3-dehydroquinate dehydratase [Phycisphaerales bacterium]
MCVPIMVHDIHTALADAVAARDAGADLVEFRIDEFFSGDLDEAPGILRMIAESPLPCIVTCRHKSEGGQYDGEEDARVSLYERLGTASGKDEHPPRYLDFELDRYTSSENIKQKMNLAIDAIGRQRGSPREHAPSLILSNHDFASRPADLSRRVLKMRGEEAGSVMKFAYRARSLRDNLELFDLLAERDRPMIALAMGEFGLISRILAPKFGGFLTFASLRPTSTTAPGQPTVSELLDLYRFRSINAETKVYGIVGWPVGHSLSPLVHNAAFEALGINAVYVPLPVPDRAEGVQGQEKEEGQVDTGRMPVPRDGVESAGYASFKATMLALIDHPRFDLCGASVTIPHKENLVRLASEQGWEMDDLSKSCSAANTLVIDRDAAGAATGIRVLNTDGPAAIACLREGIGEVAGKRIGILGAGGVARAIAMALGMAGASVTIYNRSTSRASELAQAVTNNTGAACKAAELADADMAHHEAWVNCTPVGMKGGPHPGASVLGDAAFRNSLPGTAVLDTVYNPIRTPLLERAGAAGWRTIDGVSMFARQAEAQFHAWMGRNSPGSLFERLVRERLAT